MRALTFTTLIILFSLNLQAQLWQSAQSVSGTGTETATAVATDRNNNVITAGTYTSPQIITGSTTLTNAGATDFYIYKQDAGGTITWSGSFGGTLDDYLNAMACDASGNIYITGNFASDSIVFNGTLVLVNSTPGSSYNDIFIAKLDPNGIVLWAVQAYGDSADAATSIVCDSLGNVSITGYTYSPILSFGTQSITNSSLENMFVAKYDNSGNILYAINNLLGYSNGTAISADMYGNTYVLGEYNDSVFAIGSYYIIPYSFMGWTPDLFVLKLDVTGNIAWLKGIGGTDYDIAKGIAADQLGNFYVTGSYFSNDMNFDGIVLQNHSVGGDDFYIARYDTDGNAQWAKQFDYSSGSGEALTCDLQGNAYVAGLFYEDQTIIGADTLTLADVNAYSDIFITKYNHLGSAEWTLTATGQGYETSYGLAAGNAIYITGNYSSPTMDFGTLQLSNSGNTDAFLARIDAGCNAGFYLYPDTNLLHNYIAVNTSTGNGPVTYTWSWGDGTFDTGPYPTHTYADSGYYDICLTITDSSGCSSTYCDSSAFLLRRTNSMVTITVNPSFTTAVNNIAEVIPVIVYPNPSSGSFTISLPAKRLIIQLYDSSGREIYSIEHNGAFFRNEEKLAPGIYYLRITGSGFMQGKKIIID
jgi:hypothetical protein